MNILYVSQDIYVQLFKMQTIHLYNCYIFHEFAFFHNSAYGFWTYTGTSMVAERCHLKFSSFLQIEIQKVKTIKVKQDAHK